MILADYVDKSTLWSLCLSSWRFNCVFTSKLSEQITVRIEKDDDESFVKRVVDGLIAGPYLHDLRRLQLILNHGPDFPKAILEIIDELLRYTPNLEVFTWETSEGDVPVSTLVNLSKNCPGLAELHLRSGPEINNYGSGFRDAQERPVFAGLRVLTCRSMGTWHALYLLNQCRNLERVEMTHMGYMLALGWVHSGYHAHLRALVAREEASRARDGARPLKMDMCYSRSVKANYACDVCDSPGMTAYKAGDERYEEVWPWADGRARQYLHSGQVRHITYEYPHPEPAELAAPLEDD